ncbi:MAG: glycosyltransferase [Anaerolineae bacterium]|nr:glycosyltransferase [Anaerolineae bacterium]
MIWLIGVVLLLERVWRHLSVVRFFRQPVPPATSTPRLVSILQPILSGDPTLPACLERNLRARSRVAREFIWLVDTDDAEAQRVCAGLAAQHPQVAVRVVALPPPGPRQNPKMVKLVAGVKLTQGDVICVLDDDTSLPDDTFDVCLPYLDQPGVGLVFGLPYYVSFLNLWSSLVALFVDSHSLLTYIPYTRLTEPFTINGMFYVMYRDILDRMGGFEGLEGTLADDFAVAQRVRAHGLRLAQTPLRHAISTYVTGPRHYLSLIQRWFIFPRESLMRHLAPRDQLVLYGLGLLPSLVPPLLVGALLLWPSWPLAVYTVVYLGYSYALFAHLNAAYLGHAAPWRWSWLAPLIQLVFPLQLVAALLAPQRIIWRGHVIQAERGGAFRFVRRRYDA